jgi:hypothetical protein
VRQTEEAQVRRPRYEAEFENLQAAAAAGRLLLLWRRRRAGDRIIIFFFCRLFSILSALFQDVQPK